MSSYRPLYLQEQEQAKKAAREAKKAEKQAKKNQRRQQRSAFSMPLVGNALQFLSAQKTFGVSPPRAARLTDSTRCSSSEDLHADQHGDPQPPNHYEEQKERGSAVDRDYRFCYAGRAGTSTGLHFDVLGSYSWSTNIVGRKRC